MSDNTLCFQLLYLPLWSRRGGRDHIVVGFTTTMYLCNQCLSPPKLWVRIQLRRGVLDTTLCDKVCQWFSPDTLVSSTNNTDCHDITEILLKVVLNTITPNPKNIFPYKLLCEPTCLFSTFSGNSAPVIGWNNSPNSNANLVIPNAAPNCNVWYDGII